MLTVSNCGMTGTTTAKSYSGVITLHVSGTLFGSPSSETDPFYNNFPNPIQCPDCFVYNRVSQGTCECVGSCPATQVGVNGVTGYILYNPTHAYMLTLDLGSAPPERLNFSYGDCGCGDNVGNWTLSIDCP